MKLFWEKVCLVKKKNSSQQLMKLCQTTSKFHYGTHAGQTFLNFTSFVENINNICISKWVYYENRFINISNDTNYVLQILIFSLMYLVKIEKVQIFEKQERK